MDDTIVICHDGCMDPTISCAHATYWNIIPINPSIPIQPHIPTQPGIHIQPGIKLVDSHLPNGSSIIC